MRVLMTSVWGTHYLAMVPLGWALRVAGHEVRVAVQPAHAETVVGSGLPVVVLGRDVDVVGGDDAGTVRDDGDRRSTPRARVTGALAKFVGVADSMADELVDHARAWRPHLVVHDPLAFAGPLAAAVLGVPSVRHLWGADMLAATLDGDDQAGLLAGIPRFGSMLGRFGIAALEDLGTLTLDPCPPSVQRPGPPIVRRCVRYVPYNGPGVHPRWDIGRPVRPRICITWGRTVTRYGGRITFPAAQAINAAAGMGLEVVVTTAPDEAHRLPPVPGGVRVVESVPLNTMLPGCSAVIQQGGGGTTLTALRHGVPQLVIGHLPDHVFHASRVAAAGAGIRLDARDADASSIATAISGLLADGSYRMSARRVQDEILRLPPPATVVGVLGALASRGVESLS